MSEEAVISAATPEIALEVPEVRASESVPPGGVEVQAQTYGGCQMGDACEQVTLRAGALPDDLVDALLAADLPAIAKAGRSICPDVAVDGVGLRATIITPDRSVEVACLSGVDPTVDPAVAPLLDAIDQALDG